MCHRHNHPPFLQMGPRRAEVGGFPAAEVPPCQMSSGELLGFGVVGARPLGFLEGDPSFLFGVSHDSPMGPSLYG